MKGGTGKTIPAFCVPVNQTVEQKVEKMKRILSMFLAVIALLGLHGSAFAYDQEITFQGIPWYSSVEEVRAKLDELYGKYDTQQSEGSRAFILGSDGSAFSDWYPYEKQAVSLIVQLKDVEMLSYPLDCIRFVFATDGEESKLITIVLQPKAPDLSGKAFDKMVATFVDEITGKYGEPDKNNSSQFILCGGENTAIYMYKGMDEFLWYGKTDAGTILESMKR